jgi:hypothetical protein
MPITARYILLCDDVRREDNGKFILIGMYTPDMVVQQIPFVLPTLSFFLNLESDRPGNFGFRTKVEHQETGNALPATVAMGTIAVTNPQQPLLVPVKFVGVIFNAQGLYSFSLEIENQREPIVHTFNVQLIVPQASPMSLQGGFRH